MKNSCFLNFSTVLSTILFCRIFGANPTGRPSISPTVTVDYSCLHAKSWLLNANNDADVRVIFSTNTDILSSSGNSATNIWKVTCNQIPSYKVNCTSNMIFDMNSRPQAWSDFFLSSGKTTAKVGKSYIFGSSVGYPTSSCGFWPPTSSCPNALSATLKFPINPAPEISTGFS